MIELLRVPSGVDAIEVTVRAGGRTFEELSPRPFDDRITSFSAVPAGPAEIDLKLFAGTELVESRSRIPVEIVEGEERALSVNFESGPDFTIEVPGGEPHVLYGAPVILVEIHLVNSELVVEMSGKVNGRPVEIENLGADYFVTIEAADAGDVLPGTILLEVTACLVEKKIECITKERPIVVTRAAWRTEIADETLSRPKIWKNKLVLVDGSGTLRTVTSSTGEYRGLPILLQTEVAEDIALVGDTVYASSQDGRLFAIDLSTGAQPAMALGATSAPVAHLSEVFVAAGAEIIRIRDRQVIGSLPRTVRAPPLVDDRGMVAADILGNVLALDPTGAELFRASVGAPVFAPPVRHRDRIVIATSFGELVLLDEISGAESAPRIDLTRPIAYAPIVIGERLIAAADDRVVFVENDQIARTMSVNDTITGAPVPWNDGVIVGVRSGLIRRVNDGGARTIERVGGAALGMLVIDSLGAQRGRGIAAVGSRGDLAMLELEGDF